MGNRHDHVLLLVTMGLLLLGFFSYSTGISTGYVTAAGSEHYNCIDVDEAYAQINNNGYKGQYDLDGDRDLDLIDLTALYELALQNPCPKAPECAEEGLTSCNFKGDVVVRCERDEFGTLVKREIQCPGGTICETYQQTVPYAHGRSTSLRTAECRIQKVSNL